MIRAGRICFGAGAGRGLALASAVLFGPGILQAKAEPVTGAALADMCGKYEPRASYYILGAIDALNVRLGQPKRFCMPKGSDIPSMHMTNIVCGFISHHPEQQDSSAGVLVFRALRDAYPCGAKR